MFPVVDSVVRTDALEQRVLPHYPIGDIARCRFHARGLNDTFKVETAGGTSYFLRVYRAGWRSREEIETEISILHHLARCGVNVSVPVKRIDDDVLTPLDCPEGTRFAALFTAAPGAEVDYKSYTEEQAGHYGTAAAAIHAAAESYEGPRLRPALDLASLLDRPLALLLSAIAPRAEDAAYVAELAERLRRRIAGTADLETGFCHGDLHGQNACHADAAFTVYDFDCCGWGYRAYDLAVFLWASALGEQPPERVETMGRAFLQGYLRHRPLAPADIAAIPAFVAIRQVWLIGLHIGIADRFGWGWLNARYFDRQLKVLRDWEKNFLGREAADWLVPGGP